MIFYEITEEDNKLIKEALLRLEKNFDGEKYNHTVGAAQKCKNGNIYTGVNCDGIHGSCAEYNLSIYLFFGYFLLILSRTVFYALV